MLRVRHTVTTTTALLAFAVVLCVRGSAAAECNEVRQTVVVPVAGDESTEIDLEKTLGVHGTDVQIWIPEAFSIDLPRLVSSGTTVTYTPDVTSGRRTNRAKVSGFLVSDVDGETATIYRVIVAPELTASELTLFSAACSEEKICPSAGAAPSCADPGSPPCPADQKNIHRFYFRADGTFDSESGTLLSEEDTIEAYVLARQWFADRYFARITPNGEVPSLIRGDFSVAKKFAKSDFIGAVTEAYKTTGVPTTTRPKACAVSLERLKQFAPSLTEELENKNRIVLQRAGRRSPIKNEKANIDLSLVHSDVSSKKEAKIDHRYVVNIAALVAVSSSKTEYKVIDKKISKSEDDVPLDIVVGFEFFPAPLFSGECNPFKKNMWRSCGRYFSENRTFADRFSIIAGLGLKDIGDTAYLGLGFEMFKGIQISAGWMPRREQSLQAGHFVGDTIEGDKAPVDKEWELANFGFAIGFDTNLIKSLTD